MSDAQVIDGYLGCLLNGSLRDSPSWVENDVINAQRPVAANGARTGRNRGKKGKGKGRAKVKRGAPRRRADSSSSWERGLEERQMNMGFTEDEVHELLSQGVKPWDDDAWVRVHQIWL
jgi:hypothetical protein